MQLKTSKLYFKSNQQVKLISKQKNNRHDQRNILIVSYYH